MFFTAILIFVLVAAANHVSGHDSPRVCAWTWTSQNGSPHEESRPPPQQQVDLTKNQVTCNNNKGTSCYAFWRQESMPDNSSRITVINRGCWEASGKGEECLSNICQPISQPQKIKMGNAGFCCCTGYLCNLNISFALPLPGVRNQTLDEKTHRNMTGFYAGDGEQTKALLLGGCGGVLILLLLAGVACKWGPNLQDKQQKNQQNSSNSVSLNPSSNNTYSMSQLTLDHIVGQGRYGTVWLGYLKDKPVAVKMFPSHYQQYFYNEKDIYTLPFMNHNSLLKYFGNDKMKNKDGMTNYILVLSYCPKGTLQEYLKGNTVDLITFTNMALSISSALAFLHTEVIKRDSRKPCVTHRDVNSRNILINEDLTCCLADLSLAVKIAGSHYYSLGDELHAETKSINDVGTLRYMAPEVLEGAVNLRDCESSLKQIDVYALGLVLWELAMRVTDFFNRPNDVPQYTMPFEKEVGLHPTFEEMQVLVCRNKARPLYPVEWKNCPATRAIRETIEDCTDQDGEARLTALCVHERINQIRRGVSQGGNISPTLYQTNFSTSGFSSSYCYNNHVSSTPDAPSVDREMTGGSEDTVETVVTITPSDSFPTHLSLVARDVAVIHPHQGRNPCLERNLLSCDAREELCIVQTSSKHATHSRNAEVEHSTPRPPSHQQQASIPILQNRPFSSPKLVNLIPKEQSDMNLVASLFKLVKKKEVNEEETALTNVIISPFEGQSSPQRPSSLQLLPSASKANEEDVLEEKRLKELSGRIRTPGDLPPSVRKKRGSKARLSLYDDRMMSYSAIDTTF
ncbi:hypothetical protein GE061_002293 [Apolygus lucorum]|uniref:receptor protein serine/threonine kinase n=1 Tax=Apolygus lucorum TaxID=248454 RepID=A0A6A4JGS7_APOLU|nr:hypothetical protein GE061_002293 [Apolygus lucorum]